MAYLYITELNNQGVDAKGHTAPIARMPAIAEQALAISGTSAASSAFNASTTMVRLESDVVCSVTFAGTPVATTSMMRLAADSPEYFSVPQGQSLKVAVIENT